jgi:competence protein ComEC
VFFALAVLSAVIWRTLILRATAIPLALIGFAGAASGASFDIAVGPLGDAVAVRLADGHLAVLGDRPSAFAAEQWLRADADGRVAKSAIQRTACDKLGCVGVLADGRALSLVLDQAAFAEDCLRAAVLVTPLFAPKGCAAPIVIDRESLKTTGAVTLKANGETFVVKTARSAGEDRPWSRAPKPRWGRAAPKPDEPGAEPLSSGE